MRRRASVLLGVTLVMVCGAGAGVGAAVWQPWRARTEPASSSVQLTTRVERTTLTANLVLSGQLEYRSPVVLTGTGGMVTKLPRAGDIVSTGQALYEVDGTSVVTFVGDRPLWRTLSAGVTDGPDVREVEQNLSDLGYGAGVTVDDTFTAATDRAIRAWQKDQGRERTGALEVGDVVVVSSATVRVNTVTATLGGSAGAAILSYTEPAIHGRAPLTPAQLTHLVPGLDVTVTLPTGAQVPAVVGAVDPGGAVTSDPSKPTTPSAEVDFADQSVLQGIGLPAIRVTVGADHADNALVVPVTALVALAGGGYALERASAASAAPSPSVASAAPSPSAASSSGTGDAPTLVPVTIGLIADSRAQITSGAITEGDEIVVAG